MPCGMHRRDRFRLAAVRGPTDCTPDGLVCIFSAVEPETGRLRIL